ncbi:M48 family metallopeptidase [Moraxella boevrei]|uniref:M48 family metallopeptidase n=1 Tax=Faucicola boevrei TaxID=346665 RepID=UPI0037358BE7
MAFKKQLSTSFLAIGVAFGGISACSSTTGTGAIGVNRKQMLMVSSDQVMQISNQSYIKTLQEARKDGALDTNPAQLQRLKTIANRLIAQTGAYRPDAKNWQWEVHTIKSNEINAYVMPSGKIVFYTGIIDKLQLTDDEIAAIMGHEMAHALREHARERMSRQMATQTAIGLGAAVLGLSSGQAQLAGLAGDVGLSLPNSRTQETEADLMGLELMARAGYDPNGAISLWQKMQKAGGSGMPQFLSTHPVSATRIASIQAMMPKVMPLYNQAKR